MGSWGRETFDNDTAHDFVGDVADFVINVIEKDLSISGKKRSSIIERPALAAIALLAVLAENIPAATYCVSESQVRKWRRDYFSWFEEVLPDATSPEQLKELREIAEREFNRLMDAAEGDDDEDVE